MAKRIFVNNVNSYVGQALFQQLRNDGPDNDDPNLIFGTYMEKDSSEKPDGVKKMLKRSKPKLKAKYLSECDVLLYDLHEMALTPQTAQDLQSGLEAMRKFTTDEEKIVIIVSSVMVWGNTPRKLVLKEEKKAPAEGEEGEAKEEEQPPPAPSPPEDSEDEKDMSGADKTLVKEEEEEEPEKDWVPWEEKDFPERVPVPGYERMKELEDLVLQFKKENVKVYVICSGVLYGLGETVFYEHLKSAWLQLPSALPFIPWPESIDKSVLERKPKVQQVSRPPTRDTIQSKGVGRRSQNMSMTSLSNKSPHLPSEPAVAEEEPPVITEEQLRGSNLVPTIHIRDLARLVQKVIETKPEQQYLVALDCTENREQKALVEAISKGVGTGQFEPLPENEKEVEKTKLKTELENPHVRLFSDPIWRQPLSLNLKMRPSSLLIGDEVPAGDDPPDQEGLFEWHSKGGIGENIYKMLQEFNKVRGLRPVRVLLNGPPCVGKSFYAAKLAEHYNVPIVSRAAVSKIMEDEGHPLMQELAGIEEEYELSAERWVEVMKMRLRQNDCKNRGFILDGVPECHTEALQVFMDFPRKKKPKKKPPPPEPAEAAEGGEGEEGEREGEGEKQEEEAPKEQEQEEETPEEEEPQKPQKPKMARDIIPESVVKLMASEKTLEKRGAKSNKKVFEERLAKYWKHNAIKNYRLPGREPPLERFFQLDNKTEILNLEVEGQLTSEVFESVRIYVERNQRPYNYLTTQEELNERREKALLKEEEDSRNKEKQGYMDQRQRDKKAAQEREKAVDRRVEELEEHEGELKEALGLGQREFLMKYVIPEITEGMIEVCKVVPIDPVDYLAEYLFQKSGEHRVQYRPGSSVGSVTSSL